MAQAPVAHQRAALHDVDVVRLTKAQTASVAVQQLKRLIREIHRRSLWQVLVGYLAASFAILEGVDLLIDRLGLPEPLFPFAFLLIVVGLPIVLFTALVQSSDRLGRHPRERASDRPISEGSSPTVRRLFTWRNAIYGGVLALALWGVVATGWYLLYGGAAVEDTAAATKSVAVLPFDDLSPDRENEYFCDGMTEELISKLSRIQSLQVAGRTSVMRFKGAEKDIEQVADKLGVRYVLDGSVRKAGERVRISAQLIDAATGFQLWSDDFDADMKDIFAVQEETALRIAQALDLRLSPGEIEAVGRRYTENPEAYDAYLRGWSLVESFHALLYPPEDKLATARRHFERALALESDYAPALAGLAVVEGYHYGFLDQIPEYLTRAEDLARRAVALAPRLPEAHAALALAHAYGNEYADAIEEFDRALNLDPRNAYVWCELSWVFNRMDPPDPEEAETAARESIRLQPAWFWSHYQLAKALEGQGRHEEAIAAYRYAAELEPDFWNAYVHAGRLHMAQARYDEALTQFGAARRIVETPGLLLRISAARAALGDAATALTELERALAGGFRDFVAIDTIRHFDSLRSDPRLQALLSQYE